MKTSAPKPSTALRVHVAAGVFSLAALVLPNFSSAQAVKPPSEADASAKNKESETVILNPFEVKTEKDTSYGALNSNSLTLFNVELDKVPVVADVLTQQFIQDTQVRSLEELFNNYAGGAGRAYATDTDINASQPGDRFSSDQYGVRGVAAGLPKRDGFQNFRTQQNEVNLFDTERLDVVHGSQGLLYGAAGAGGVVNLVSKQARFNNTSARFSDRIDQYGSQQYMLDANQGYGKAAVRVVGLHDVNQTRRLFIGNKTDGLYSQLAFKLPFNTTLRANAEVTHNRRQLPNGLSVSFPTAINDPRNGQNLLYLVATGQTGATNPATGAAYPGGALTRAKITTENYASFLGWHSEDDSDLRRGGISLDTVWTPWLSTSFAAATYLKYGVRDPNGSNLLAPGATNNATGDWAVAPSFSDSTSSNRAKMYRASVLITKDLFNGKARTQTAVGFNRTYEDTTSQGGNNVVYNYYLADASGNVPFDITKTNGGRTAYGSQAWTVGDGPIKTPLIKSAAGSIMRNGQLFVRMPANPRSKDWILPNNPMGLASLYANYLNRLTSPTSTSTNGISGGNASGFESETKSQGTFIANNTDWFDGRLQTFFGARESYGFTRDPNATVGVNVPYVEVRQGPFPSYNAGFVYKLMRLPGEGALRGYYGYSRTWNVTNGANDAYGLEPPNPKGITHEGGLKFTAYNNRLSGNLSFFLVDSKNENYSAGSTYRDTVNPTGLNGAYVSPTGAKNNWAHYDKTTRGVELSLTAQPMRNWGLRAVISLNDGTVKSDSTYGLLYNDQFYTNTAKTAVTYNDGSPFLVPADSDATGIARVNALALGTRVTDPTTLSANLVPLTLAMINDSTSNYYAFGKNTFAQNQPQNGSIGTGTTGSGTNILKIVLTNFQPGGRTALTGATGLPISAIQYNWADPAGFRDRGYIVQRKGDATVGYPVFRFNLTNYYEFTEGWLKGLRPGGTVSVAAWNYSYWYATPDLKRHLYQAAVPNPQVNLFASYSHKLGKYRWSTQLNVNNVFNHYQLNFTPNNGTGFTNPNNIGVSYSGEPRLYIWTNSVSF